jgi:hypothetical protein
MPGLFNYSGGPHDPLRAPAPSPRGSAVAGGLAGRAPAPLGSPISLLPASHATPKRLLAVDRGMAPASVVPLGR